MQIGFYLADQNPHRDRTIGITTYTAALLHELLKSDDVRISAISSTSSLKAPAGLVNYLSLPFRTDSFLGRLVADQTHPLFVRPKVDLWHYPKGFLPFALRYPTPIVGTVCDVILQHYADKYPRARSALAYRYWLGLLKRSLARFDIVCTISEFSKQQILAFCARYRIRAPRIVVTYLGCDWSRLCETSKQDYVLHLASKEPHKRTRTLLEFWRTLEMQPSGLNLVVSGPLTGEDRSFASKIPSVRISERMNRADILTQMRGARALIISSEIEGFGLPALEAYSGGTPVVYVKGTAVEEVLGKSTPGGFQLNLFDSFQKALREVLEMDNLAIETARRRLEARFSWNRCAAETLAVYRSVRSN